MNKVLIGCNCNSSFSIPKISIASLCSKIFSGLSLASISNSPVCWAIFSGLSFASITTSPVCCTKFSGLGIPAMNKVLIGCNCNSSFSMPKISIASLCSNIFSGLSLDSISNSPVCWVIFSGLSLASMTNSPVCWAKFSGFGIAAMNKVLIGCNCNSSFSMPNISIESLCSLIFSGRSFSSMTNSPDFCTSFSGFLVPSMINWLIGWITGSSFSAPWISKESLCSKMFSALASFSITNSPDLCTSFSGLSKASTTRALINCVTIGAFSIATISILSRCWDTFSGLAVFWISTKSLTYSRFSQGNFCPWMNM